MYNSARPPFSKPLWVCMLALLLAFCIPLQSYAAATMMLCQDMDGGSSTSGAHCMAQDQAAHDMHKMHDVSLGSTAQVGDTTEHKMEHDMGSACSVCAVGCHAVAIEASTAQVEVRSMPSSITQMLPSKRPSFLTSGLDRPPRPA